MLTLGCFPQDVRPGDVMQKKNMWEVMGETSGGQQVPKAKVSHTHTHTICCGPFLPQITLIFYFLLTGFYRLSLLTWPHHVLLRR